MPFLVHGQVIAAGLGKKMNLAKHYQISASCTGWKRNDFELESPSERRTTADQRTVEKKYGNSESLLRDEVQAFTAKIKAANSQIAA